MSGKKLLKSMGSGKVGVSTFEFRNTFVKTVLDPVSSNCFVTNIKFVYPYRLLLIPPDGSKEWRRVGGLDGVKSAIPLEGLLEIGRSFGLLKLRSGFGYREFSIVRVSYSDCSIIRISCHGQSD